MKYLTAFSLFSVALSVSIFVLQPVQVLFKKHLQLQEPCLTLPSIYAVIMCSGTLLSVPLHRPSQACQEAHAVLPFQTQHPYTTSEGWIFTHTSRKREVSVSEMCISELFYICDKKAHHSQASQQYGRTIYWLQIAQSRQHSYKDLLLQGL